MLLFRHTLFSHLTKIGEFNEIWKAQKGWITLFLCSIWYHWIMVGQTGKALGLYVVGSAGSEKKWCILKKLALMLPSITRPMILQKPYLSYVLMTLLFILIMSAARCLKVSLKMQTHFQKCLLWHDVQKQLWKARTCSQSLSDNSQRFRSPWLYCKQKSSNERKFRKTTGRFQNDQIRYHENIAESIQTLPQTLVDGYKNKNFGKQVDKMADL